jgi:hypothetical protein
MFSQLTQEDGSRETIFTGIVCTSNWNLPFVFLAPREENL